MLCSYVTLPLYALVNQVGRRPTRFTSTTSELDQSRPADCLFSFDLQMGSNLKPAIFHDHVAMALRKWHRMARKNIKERNKSGNATPSSSRPGTPPRSMSPVHLLKYHRGEMSDSLHASPRFHGSDRERIDYDGSTSPVNASREGSYHLKREFNSPHEVEETASVDQEASHHHSIHVSGDFSFERRYILQVYDSFFFES